VSRGQQGGHGRVAAGLAAASVVLVPLACCAGVALVSAVAGSAGLTRGRLLAAVVPAGLVLASLLALGLTRAARAVDHRGRARSLGPLGVVARVVVGLSFILLELVWRQPHWWDAALGLGVMPALVTGFAMLRSRRSPQPLSATGPVGHVVNVLVLIPLFVLPATAGAAFLFYGTSMLLAAARGTGGCEVTAISNALLARDDQVGCVLFAPIDAAERRR
jgi:hypothetical protein